MTGEALASGQRQGFSLLSPDPASHGNSVFQDDREFITDLNIDQIVGAVAGGRDESELISSLLYHWVPDGRTLRYRHEVFRDLENAAVFDGVSRFCERIREVRTRLRLLGELQSGQQRQGWFLDAAAIYCDAVRSLAEQLAGWLAESRALHAFRGYLADYVSSDGFARLAAETARCKNDLAGICYLVRIKGTRVEVSRYDGEPDYSAEIARTFERFRQGGAAKEYLATYRGWPGMNHIGAQILDFVARLFGDEFGALGEFCDRHAGFLDPVVRQFDREVQFYLAYLEYLKPMRSAGLSFCYPDLTADSKEIFASGTFDLALAARLARAGERVVTNEFRLTGPERVIVVSGPNQGGKTTFARAFGQLHHLAGSGCPVPGREARLFLPDQIFTHFEREEDLASLTGRLEDDLLRIQKILRAATPASILIMNEIFSSTALTDARFLGEQVLKKVTDLDLLCVWVTFVEELAAAGPGVVSMASTIVPGNPAERTYQVVRKPADGLAYALAIAREHGVTYEQLKGRLTS